MTPTNTRLLAIALMIAAITAQTTDAKGYAVTDVSIADFGSADLTEYFDYLDELRESGATNMFGAAPYLQREFLFDKDEARVVLRAWQRTFSDKPASDRAFEALDGAGGK